MKGRIMRWLFCSMEEVIYKSTNVVVDSTTIGSGDNKTRFNAPLQDIIEFEGITRIDMTITNNTASSQCCDGSPLNGKYQGNEKRAGKGNQGNTKAGERS